MKIEISRTRPERKGEKTPKNRRSGICKKTEFSKKWLIGCIAFSAFFTAASYVLAIFDKQPLETLASTIIQTLWGASEVSFASYAVQNCVRSYTASRFGIPTQSIGNSEQLKGVDTQDECK